MDDGQFDLYIQSADVTSGPENYFAGLGEACTRHDAGDSDTRVVCLESLAARGGSAGRSPPRACGDWPRAWDSRRTGLGPETTA